MGYSQVDSDGIIALPQTDKASAGSFILDSLNLELDINGNETYVNLGRQRDHPSAKQPVTLGGEGHSVGLYYTVDQELKADALGWETWMSMFYLKNYGLLFLELTKTPATSLQR